MPRAYHVAGAGDRGNDVRPVSALTLILSAATRVAFGEVCAYGPGMSMYPTTLERAFTLARSGKYAGVAEIRAQLKVEGYQLSQLEGRSLQRQLRELCVAANRDSSAEVIALEADPPGSTRRGRS